MSLKIGIDFDNTIVLYDALIYQCALEKKLIAPHITANKKVVRDEIRRKHGNDQWTLLQSVIYGERMPEALLAPGFPEFLDWAQSVNAVVYVVSHKTQFPAMGKQNDLRLAALDWMHANQLFEHANGIIQPDGVYFEDTMENKAKRISLLECDIFIDDLEEMLTHPAFPTSTKKILYGPPHKDLISHSDWHSIQSALSE